MKKHFWKLAGLLSCASFVFLVSCAADPTNCPSGQVYGGTTYGCQPQGSCSAGMFQLNGTGGCLSPANTAAVATGTCYSGYTLNAQINMCCPATTYGTAYGTTNTSGCIAPTTTGVAGQCPSGCTYYSQYNGCYTPQGQNCGSATGVGTTPTPSGPCPVNSTAGCYYYAQYGHCYYSTGQYCGD